MQNVDSGGVTRDNVLTDCLSDEDTQRAPGRYWIQPLDHHGKKGLVTNNVITGGREMSSSEVRQNRGMCSLQSHATIRQSAFEGRGPL